VSDEGKRLGIAQGAERGILSKASRKCIAVHNSESEYAEDSRTQVAESNTVAVMRVVVVELVGLDIDS
jgi:hypothetical protein